MRVRSVCLMSVLFGLSLVAASTVWADEKPVVPHQTLQGTVVEKAGSPAVRVPNGTTYQLNENRALRHGHDMPKIGDEVTVVIDENNMVLEVHPPNTYNGVLTFGPVSSQAELFGLYIVDGKIDSFDSAMIHHASGVPDPSPQEFWIQFTSGHACYGYPCSPPPPPCNYPAICIDVAPAGVSQFDPTQRGVYLFNSLTGSPIDMAQFVGPAQDIGIPEPGTLSLLLGALGGGWLARRRRKEKVPDTS